MDAPEVKAWTHLDLYHNSQEKPQDVYTVSLMRGAECGTDHKLVVVKLKMRIKRKVRATGAKVPKCTDVC